MGWNARYFLNSFLLYQKVDFCLEMYLHKPLVFCLSSLQVTCEGFVKNYQKFISSMPNSSLISLKMIFYANNGTTNLNLRHL